jgi:hypothetical protein
MQKSWQLVEREVPRKTKCMTRPSAIRGLQFANLAAPAPVWSQPPSTGSGQVLRRQPDRELADVAGSKPVACADDDRRLLMGDTER